jgi:CRISPR-associated protein Cas1
MSVYLTSTCRNATLRGRTLVIEHSEGERRIPWDRVGRLVLVGRPAGPPAILHRAARASIRVSFLDALGRLVGLLQTPSPVSAQLRLRQEESLADENWRLKTAREMIAAKIHNCRVILRRNNADEPRLGGMEETRRGRYPLIPCAESRAPQPMRFSINSRDSSIRSLFPGADTAHPLIQ